MSEFECTPSATVEAYIEDQRAQRFSDIRSFAGNSVLSYAGFELAHASVDFIVNHGTEYGLPVAGVVAGGYLAIRRGGLALGHLWDTIRPSVNISDAKLDLESGDYTHKTYPTSDR